MRAKIGRGDFAAVVFLGGFRVRIVEHDEADEGRIFRRQGADEGNDVLAVLVAACPRSSTFCAVPVLPEMRVTGNGRFGRGAALAHHATQRERDLGRRLRR